MGRQHEQSKPTVMVVGPFSGTGGVVTFQRNLMQQSPLNKRWRFVAFSNSRPPKKNTSENLSYGALFNAGLLRVFIGAFVTKINLLAFPFALLKHRPAVVQIQSSDYFAFWESALYQLIASSLGFPTVVRFGGSFNVFYESSSPRAQRLIRWVLNRPRRIVVQSRMWHTYFAALISNPDRLQIVPNAVVQPPEFVPRLNKTTPPRALLICGENARLKGVYTVLDALTLLDHSVHIDLVSVGDRLHDEVRQHPCSDDITVHPTLSHADITKLYTTVDIFLIPSEREGFPNSLLEAMAAGLPVIGSPVGAIPEVLIDGQGGFFHDHLDSQLLAAHLKILIDDASLRERFGRYNHQRIGQHYVLDRTFEPFNTLWSSLTEDKPRRF